MENKKIIIYIILGICLVSIGVFCLFKDDNKIIFNKDKIDDSIIGKINAGEFVSTSELYKVCNKSFCPSSEININGFIFDRSEGDPVLASKKDDKLISLIQLKPSKTMTVLDKYNLLNRDGNLLKNGILEVKISGTIFYDPIFFDTLEDSISLDFNLSDIQVLSKSGCLTGVGPYYFNYGNNNCFIPVNYTISASDAYNKLIKSKLYKEAHISWVDAMKRNVNGRFTESFVWDGDEETYLIGMNYEADQWTFYVDEEGTPSPGACKDKFKVSKEKVFYERICHSNSYEIKDSYGIKGFSLEE
jgi:hypothetical protein